MNITRIVGSLIGLTMALVAILFPLGSQADAETYPDYVKIKSVNFGGSGCPYGTADLAFDPDDPTIFSLIFDAYSAAVGEGIPFTESRKHCTIIVKLEFPQGFSFTLFEADYTGFVDLDKKVFATQRSEYYFEGEPRDKAVFQSTFGSYNYPVQEDYYFTDRLELKGFVWSPCGKERALVLKTSVNVNNRKNPYGQGQITTDTITGEVIHKYGIKWRQCNPY